MKPWQTLSLSVVLAALAGAAATWIVGTPARAAEGENELASATRARVDALSAALAKLETRQRDLAGSLGDAALDAVTAAPAAGFTPAELDAAIERAMASRRAGAGSLDDGTLATAPDDADVRKKSKGDLVSLLLTGDLSGDELQALWQEVREAGRMDEVIAEFERRAALDPHNPDMQAELGRAYVQKIFEVGSSPLAGVYGGRADEAFDRALDLDPTHWGARFSKAISLSNWPAFMGKSGEAIRQFEILAEQQKSGPKKSSYVQTYYFLGNLYDQTGNHAKALAVWRDGLAMFPGDKRLLQQIALAEKAGD